MTKQDVKDRLTVPDGVELVYSDACDLPVGVFTTTDACR